MLTIAIGSFLILALSSPACSQNASTETIWSSVVVTRYGDRTPLISPQLSVLTPLGAQQLYSAGSLFRDRYIAPPSPGSDRLLQIDGISPFEIDVTQTFVQSTIDEFTLASAQAFMQGLYPPVNSLGLSSILNSEYLLSNGSNVQFPLGGYQYPLIYTTSSLDPNSIWLAGGDNCQSYDNSGLEYFNTPEYSRIESDTAAFYASFEPGIFEGVLDNTTVNYHNAYLIWDYLSYGYTHNSTVQQHLPSADLFQAQTLADSWEFAINGNVSAGDGIRTIGGQTLAAYILGLLINNIENDGQANKLNLLFTSFEPMISFAALAGLPDLYTQFYGVPDLGSSMAFELFSYSDKSSATYPDPSDLNVRFLFRNGTNSTTNLDEYPLFGRGEGSVDMSFNDFVSSMENIMLASVGDWCTICNSTSVFCPAFVNGTVSNGGNTSSPSPAKSSPATHPAIAGIIGAIIALVLIGILLAVMMLIFGVRFYRLKAKRQSELGGFKGAEKLASDQDLSIIKGSGAGATVVGQSHERVGSWELGESSLAKETGGSGKEDRKRASFEGDGTSVIEQHFEPVRVEERV